MDFTGKKVVHNRWGEGIIKRITTIGNYDYYDVQFADGQHTLLFPDAFREATVFANSNDQYELRQMIAAHEWGKLKEAAAWTAKTPEKPAQVQRRTTSPTPKTPRPVERPNIVFKCNYCDGGSSQKHIGYMGACSYDTIRYNIEVAKHSWCSDPECPCNQYYYGELDGHALDELCVDGGFTCYESKMLKEWTASAGTYLTKDRKMEPKKIRNVQVNSLAVLTTRMPYAQEEERFIFGVFLVDDADEGNNVNEGFVRSDSQYRIELSPEEAKQLLFWNYHANDTKPERAVWGQGLYRYTNNIEATQILRDIVMVKKDPREKKFAEEFLAHFCAIKKINLAEISEPNGALKR